MNASSDPIESFIRSNRKFSISLLMNSHAHLSMTQVNKGGLTFEDVLQSLYVQGQTMNTIEINSHSMLILGILVPALTTKGQIKLQMPKEMIGNESNFIKSILNLMYIKCGNVEYPFVEEFKAEAIIFLKNKLNQAKFQDVNTNGEGSSFQLRGVDNNLTNGGYGSLQQLQQRKTPSNVKNNTSNSLVPDSDLPDDHKQTASRIEFEKSEPIVRLLAQVRKVGMDILFPQSTHDKILACIFVAIRSSSTPAHRELIDMVMAVKESNKISQLEHVSKTKVRGVLALLKHGELLVTQGAEGEPVRLYLGQGINTFRDLRERHDVFLGRYMLEHHLFIPAILKSELVWQFEEETKLRRLETLNKLVAQLHYFYKSYISYQQQLATEAEESGIPIIRATSSDDMNGSGTPSVAATSVPSRNNSITNSIPSRNGSITSPAFFQNAEGGGGSRLSGSDFGSTTASERSSMRLEADFLGGTRTDEWGNARPQSLPSSLLQGGSQQSGGGGGGEQRPKSTAGFTSHQHSQMQHEYGPGLSPQASSYQPQPSRGGGGGNGMGGYGGGGGGGQYFQHQHQQSYSQQQQFGARNSVGNNPNSEHRQKMVSSSFGGNLRQQQQQEGGYNMWGHGQMGSHDDGEQGGRRGGGRGGALEPEVDQGGYNVFSGDSLRGALPQPPLQDYNAPFRANNGANGSHFRGMGGNNQFNNNQQQQQQQQQQMFNRDGYYQQQQHTTPLPQWNAQQQQQFKTGGGLLSNGGISRVGSSDAQGQYLSAGAHNGSRRSGDFSTGSMDAFDTDARQQQQQQQQAGGNRGGMRLPNNQLLDDEANDFLVAHAGAEGDRVGRGGGALGGGDRANLDWSDFGAALPGRGLQQGRASVRVNSQSLAAALDAEKARIYAAEGQQQSAV